MSCPCPDPACSDIHAHDVTAVFTVTLPPLSQLLGLPPAQAGQGVPGGD